MTDTLRWMFEMQDHVSGPARSASVGLEQFIQTTHSALASVQLMAQGAQTAGRMIAAGLAPAIMKETTLGAFETLMGTAEKARDFYAEAVQFASVMPFTTGEVVQGFKQALQAQFEPEEVPLAVRIIGDATSMSANAGDALQRVFFQMAQMRAKNKLTMEDLMPITEATGMKLQALQENLAKAYGVGTREISQMMSKGAIDGSTAAWAVLQTLQQQFSGNMERASKKVQGLWSTISSFPDEYLSALADTSGYTRLADSLKNIADNFSPSSERGQQFLDIVTDLGSGLLERVADSMGRAADAAFSFAEGFGEGFTSFADTMEVMDPDKSKAFAQNMKEIGTAAGMLAKAVIVVGDALGTAYGWLVSIGNWWKEHPGILRAMELIPGAGGVFRAARGAAEWTAGEPTTGTGVGTTQEALRRGLLPNVPAEAPIAAKENYLSYADGYGSGVLFAEGTEQGMRDQWGWHSPPKLFVQAGEDSANAYQMGLEKKSGDAAGTLAGGISGGGLSVDLSGMIVQVGDVGGRDATSVGRTIGDTIQAQVLAMLERFALQGGRI